MRVKFPDEPSKFVESEVELDDEIKRMHAIAAVPELYPILVKVGHARTAVRPPTHSHVFDQVGRRELDARAAHA